MHHAGRLPDTAAGQASPVPETYVGQQLRRFPDILVKNGAYQRVVLASAGTLPGRDSQIAAV